MSTKTFTPLPVIDFIYEGNHVIYYPPSWSKNITARSTNVKPVQKFFNRIRINKLHPLTTEGDLHMKFSYFGPIASISPIKIFINRHNNYKEERYAFISYFYEEDAQCALHFPMKFLKGRTIFVYQAKQESNYVEYDVKPKDRIYNNHTILAINEKYKEIFFEKDGSVKKKNSMITAIDPYIPMNMKRSTILSFSDDSSSTSSDDVNLNPIKECNPLLEEPVLKELPIVFTNSVDKIENGCEFKPQGFCGLDNEEIDNFVSSDPIYYINDNQTFQEADNVNCDESENPLTVFPTYYDDNQIICNDAIPQQSEISLYQGNECYDFNNEYYIPKENITFDPFYVDPSMCQEALVPIINTNYSQTEYNQFYPGGPMVYNTFPEYEISNRFNDEQQIAHLPRLLIPMQVPISGDVGISQPQNFPARNQPERSSIPINNYSYYVAPPSIEPAQYFPACEIQPFINDYSYSNRAEIIDLTQYEDMAMSMTPINNAVPQYIEQPQNLVPNLNPFEDYSVGCDELLEQCVSLREQFPKAPLQPSEWETREELQSQCDSNETINNFFSYYNSSSDEDKLEDCSTYEQSNLLEISETVIEPKKPSPNEEINVDICESEEVQLKISDKPTKCGYYTISVRDIATQFPEIGENVITTIAPEADELNMEDMETQTICTPKNANRDSSPLRVTYANATKSAKRRNRRKKKKLNN